MALFTAINLATDGFLDDIQVFVDAVLGLVEGEAEEGEEVADLKGGVMVDGAAPDGVEPGGLHVDLCFVGDVDVGLAGELCAGQL